MTLTKLPQRKHVYQNHTFDSTRWHQYLPREDDIIISTSYKSGTTWMQNIVYQLLSLEQALPQKVYDTSPWVDSRFQNGPVEELMAVLEAQKHRRFVKTHLPLDALPFYPQVKYIVVGRDARDVFMSWWNHYSNYTDSFYTYLNNIPGRIGEPMPRCPQNIHEYWQIWITRGWFEWESEGYPHSGNMYHTQTWWEFRHLNNIMFIHFNDLLANIEGEIRQVAQFLDISVSEEAISEIVSAVNFSTIKKNATKDPSQGTDIWKEGMRTFFFKGTNGRWKGVLSEEELAMYEAAKSRVLTSGCARWLEQGRVTLS